MSLTNNNSLINQLEVNKNDEKDYASLRYVFLLSH